ncbi:MAG: hypothetical protein A3J10_00345 [Candidatus Sungbacteria bacterium RIFCSPLOWO2_02_FULL_54_10]|uniref:Uncharacterized protein n=1 Tax=Candidatus Sungbacteria bacterium RIFCSPHIGHO2_02_FULL_53_17 TaxID=1802275 RepID=A0A1G2KYZ5_9BACT|nr:MAG: hypothetical protein A3C92_01075 [Candidatus Sungbacteria bacterium RIFCSPHIGHO2_02_FULL_53_17]OHA12226.1 MAG: hypothetical protein A3J10_00345 [Candidatus Sungbacteria bacterium RIFCSPLOWO2_02_FULL_54_10]
MSREGWGMAHHDPDHTVATIIYRPPNLDVPPALKARALLTRTVKTWKPEECPLHAKGSPALRPKEHWAELITCVA